MLKVDHLYLDRLPSLEKAIEQFPSLEEFHLGVLYDQPFNSYTLMEHLSHVSEPYDLICVTKF
jgi:hypothetical protein